MSSTVSQIYSVSPLLISVELIENSKRSHPSTFPSLQNQLKMIVTPKRLLAMWVRFIWDLLQWNHKRLMHLPMEPKTLQRTCPEVPRHLNFVVIKDLWESVWAAPSPHSVSPRDAGDISQVFRASTFQRWIAANDQDCEQILQSQWIRSRVTKTITSAWLQGRGKVSCISYELALVE